MNTAVARTIPKARVGTRGIVVGISLGLIITGFIAFPLMAVVAPTGGGGAPQRIAVVIEDDLGWQAIFVEFLQGAGFVVQPCVTFCDHPQAMVFIVDGLDPNEIPVGPGFVRTLRANHPNAFIVGKSSNLAFRLPGSHETLQMQFLAAGANAVWETSGSLESLINLLPK